MSDFRISPTQEDGTPWEEPTLLEKLPLIRDISLPYGHPYKQCMIEYTRLQMASRLEGYAAYADIPLITSLADLLAYPLKAYPASEVTEKMRNSSKKRQEKNLLESARWRQECDRVFNGSIYKQDGINREMKLVLCSFKQEGAYAYLPKVEFLDT